MTRIPIVAFVALFVIALVPSASALAADMQATPETCFLGPATSEQRDLDPATALGETVAGCTTFGITPNTEPHIAGVGGLTLEAGDSTKIGVTHENGLGGSVYFVRTGHSIQLHWTQGITHCWIDIPVDGAAGDIGPHCVY